MTKTSDDDPLSRLENELQEKEEALVELSAEIADLKRSVEIVRAIPSYLRDDLNVVVRTLQRINGTPSSAAGTATKSLLGETIVSAASIILGEDTSGEMHFADIAKEAIRRGYSSGRKDSTEDKIITSFGQTLRRLAGEGEVFEQAGEGKYRLRKNKTDEG